MLAIRIRKQLYLANSFKLGNHYIFISSNTSVKSDTPDQPLADVGGTAMEWDKKREMWPALYPFPHPRPTQRQYRILRGAAGSRSLGILHEGRPGPQ